MAQRIQMSKGRLEAFSDGVIAIIITIMVLELKVPHSADLAALRSLIPVFLSYVLSFVFIGIYWNNHHHLLQAVRQVNGRILWANLHLLFWLSLIPFVTGWMGENHFAAWPVALYGVVLLLDAIAYFILTRVLVSYHGEDSPLAKAMGKDFKGKISPVFYVAAIPLAFVNSWLACALYVLVAIMWLIPDRRIEHVLVEPMA
jgi:TMEM175 potassium channel family protein